MLATQRMSSNGGHQNFPFGYQPHNIHGIGLPDFMNPGPPAGQPLLNDHENQDLNDFFSDFDTQAISHKHASHAQYTPGGTHETFWNMPPTFVGSETSLGPRSGVEPHHLQGNTFGFGDGMGGHDMNTMSTHHNYGGMHNQPFADHSYPAPLMNQLHSAAMAMQPGFGGNWNPNYNQATMAHRPSMDFGSDAHFQPSGYEPPAGLTETEVGHMPLDWFEAGSSATNTAPNTQPNTQPSSPVWSKKRKLEDYQQISSRRNGFVSGASNGHHFPEAQPSPPNSNPPRLRKSASKPEHTSQPPTPLSNSKPHTPLDSQMHNSDVQDEDAEAEDDDSQDPHRPPSPAPWPSSKARPPKSNKPPPPAKPPRNRKKSSVSIMSISDHPKLQRSKSSSTPSTRVPLTQEQKKMNHTNSEQRRRDATAKAYADLYDLVPELEEMGKQSTMKKLEIVVQKVHTVKSTVEELRMRLGLDIKTGLPLQGRSSGVSGDGSSSGGAQGWR